MFHFHYADSPHLDIKTNMQNFAKIGLNQDIYYFNVNLYLTGIFVVLLSNLYNSGSRTTYKICRIDISSLKLKVKGTTRDYNPCICHLFTSSRYEYQSYNSRINSTLSALVDAVWCLPSLFWEKGRFHQLYKYPCTQTN